MARFSPDGGWLATAGRDDTARLFRTADRREIGSIAHAGTVYGVAFSPDNRFLATWSADKSASLVDVASGNKVSQIDHDDHIRSLAVSPDSMLLATASDDHTAQLTWLDPQRWFDRLCEKAGRNLSVEEWEESIGDSEPWQPTCAGWTPKARKGSG